MRHLRCEKENNPAKQDLEESEMNELKPCPFCGNKKVTINLYKKRGTPSGDDGWNAEIRCKCHAFVRFWALKKSWARQSAIEAWNHRAEQGQTAKATETEALLNRYAAAARTIALYLDEFCDTGKPYDEMIACAARSAAEALERVKQELDAAVKCLCASCKKISLSGNMITCCGMCHWHSKMED